MMSSFTWIGFLTLFSIFLYEKANGYKASLRSNDYVNVAEVCSTFGGGGHIKAAGATMTKDLEESLGIIKSFEKKSEFYQEDDTQNTSIYGGIV